MTDSFTAFFLLGGGYCYNYVLGFYGGCNIFFSSISFPIICHVHVYGSRFCFSGPLVRRNDSNMFPVL